MNSDSGCADSTDPSTISDKGRVDQHGFEARLCPANPPTMKIIDICEPSNACANTRTVRLRLARESEEKGLSVICLD